MNLLKRMIKEEWRMHSLLFGGRNFLLFPLVVGMMAVFLYGALLTSGFTASSIREGLHYVTFLFGLNVGAIGFVGRDAIKNLLGESNLLIFSSHTLPIARLRLIATFLVKDLIYYSVLFITPITVALIPAELYGGYGLSFPVLLWVTVIGMFTTGVSVSFLLASLYNRGRLFFVGGLTGFGGVLWYFHEGIIEFTPLGLYLDISVASFLFGFLPLILLMGVGLAVFTPGIRSVSRSYRDQFSYLRRGLRVVDENGLVAKFVLDMKRSSGGVVKLMLSFGIVLFVFALLSEWSVFRGFMKAPALFFALVISIGSVSVYNWLNRFDDVGSYRMLPVSKRDIFVAKYVAFFLFSLPLSLFFLLVAGYVYGFVGVLAGLLLLPPAMLYVLGVTVYLTGLNPNRMLLDGRYFLMYTAANGVVFVPLFIGSLFYSRFLSLTTAFMLVFTYVMGGVGYYLCRAAPDRWEEVMS